MIKVPDLTANNALEFSGELQDYQLSEGEVFDFSEVHNCDPFPMLVVSRTIWQLRKHSDVKKCVAHECKNGYAEHMRFSSMLRRLLHICIIIFMQIAAAVLKSEISSNNLLKNIGFKGNRSC